MTHRAFLAVSVVLVLALAPALRAGEPDPALLVEAVGVARGAMRDLQRLACAHVRTVHGVGQVQEVDDLVARVEAAFRRLSVHRVKRVAGEHLHRGAEQFGDALRSEAWWDSVRALPAPEEPGGMRDPRVDEVLMAVAGVVEPLWYVAVALLRAAEAMGTSAELTLDLWDVEDATDELRTCLFQGLLGPTPDPMVLADRLRRFNGEVLLRLAEHRAAADLPPEAREAIGKVANRAMVLDQALDDGLRGARAGGPPIGDLLPALDDRWRALDEAVAALATALPADLVRPRRRTPAEQQARAHAARAAARAWVLSIEVHAWAFAAVRVRGEERGLLGATAAGVDEGFDRLGSRDLVVQLSPSVEERLEAGLRRWKALRPDTVAAPGATPAERLAEIERTVGELDALHDDARVVLAAWDTLARERGRTSGPAEPELEQTQDALADLRAHLLGALVGLDAHAKRVADARPRLTAAVGHLLQATPEWALPLAEELPVAHAALEVALDAARGVTHAESAPALDAASEALAALERALQELERALEDARRLR